MTPHDYTALDAEIIRHINDGANTFTSMTCSPRVLDLAKPFETERVEGWRVIDRRLQVLRKQGKIRFQKLRRAWEINDRPAGDSK